MLHATVSGLLFCGATVSADENSAAAHVPGPTDKLVEYSPYPTETFANRVYFGDTHLHTSYSTDAGMLWTLIGPEDAYRFARGEEVRSNHGLPAKLQRPLDFLVVTDHA